MTSNLLEDKLWIIANDKEKEYEFFCAMNNLDAEDAMSLRFFVNEEQSEEGQKRADFYSDGCWVSWIDFNGQEYKIFVKNPLEAKHLEDLLKKNVTILSTDRWQVANGVRVGGGQ